MIQDSLKALAETEKWTYNYGSGSWQNLIEGEAYDRNVPFEDRTVFLLLYNVDKKESYGKISGLEREVYSGYLFLGLMSDYQDPDYNTKYDNNFKPLMENYMSKVRKTFTSCDYNPISLDIKESSNILASNLDGYTINFVVEKA